ncbi:hypothetical protein SH501x_003131 [Pirellulaceae bacterium SH501]
MSHTEETLERIGRECFGRLLAILAAKSKDLAAAEDYEHAIVLAVDPAVRTFLQMRASQLPR